MKKTEVQSADSFLRRWRPHLLALLCLFVCTSPARADEDELLSLELYNGAQAETVSVGRSLRPASQTAENITVVTAKEIEALNAHTLVDVLNLVTGVQIEYIRTPGSLAFINLQGSNYNHILVLFDNVPINNLPNNAPDIGAVPVQMIERIEIVKGAASSSWGNALGGVINIITKAPQTERPVNGMLSASGGKAATIDGRGEVTGTAKGFGYYLTGGKLRSDGLLPNNFVDLNHFYGKLHYELPRQGSVTVTTAVSDASRGELRASSMNLDRNSDITQLIATLSAQYPLGDRVTIDGMFRTRQLESDLLSYTISNGRLVSDVRDKESTYGGVVKAAYVDDLQRVVAGIDYDHLKVDLSEPQMLQMSQDYKLNRSDDRIGVYLNDTFTLGRFAITPSARFDHTETSGELFSPSFGITYAVTDNTVLRGYTAKGYSLTSLNIENSLEKVWTSQVGFESADIPFIWLKGTLFRNETWNINDGSGSKQRQLKEGYEVEARTLPVYATSLSVGYTYVDGRSTKSDAVVKGIARHTLNTSLKYEDERYLRAVVTGHYIDWNADPRVRAKYSAMVVDLHLAKTFRYSDTVSVELFGSVRNLFNGAQYDVYLFKNPGRWGEVGVRCVF